MSTPMLEDVLVRVRAGQKIMIIADSDLDAERQLGGLVRLAKESMPEPVAGERALRGTTTYEHPSGGYVVLRSRRAASFRGLQLDLIVLSWDDLATAQCYGTEVKVVTHQAGERG